MKMSAWISAGFALLLLGTAGSEAVAQDRPGHQEKVRWTIGIHTGLGLTGRFIEQYVLPGDSIHLPPIADRVLDTSPVFNLGGSVGVWLLERINLEAGYTWMPGHFRYRDNTGTGSEALNEDDIAHLTMHLFTLQAYTYILPERARLSPYITAAFNGTIFHLSDEDRSGTVLLTSDGSHIRMGSTSGIGLRYRASPKLAFRLGANFNRLGNPFRGKDSFLATTGFTFDKAESVRLTQFRFDATYTFRHRRH